MKTLLILCLVFTAVAAIAGPNPYDEKADAKLDIKQALAGAISASVPVIIVFGANWCPDCRVLDIAMHSGPSGELLAKNFKIVKVNIGRRDQNLDIAESYGMSLKKGIPTVVIVSPKNEVLYATHEGELADARNMGDKGIFDFFRRVTAAATLKK
jgi:protein disulfide-isomerase